MTAGHQSPQQWDPCASRPIRWSLSKQARNATTDHSSIVNACAHPNSCMRCMSPAIRSSSSTTAPSCTHVQPVVVSNIYSLLTFDIRNPCWLHLELVQPQLDAGVQVQRFSESQLAGLPAPADVLTQSMLLWPGNLLDGLQPRVNRPSADATCTLLLAGTRAAVRPCKTRPDQSRAGSC